MSSRPGRLSSFGALALVVSLAAILGLPFGAQEMAGPPEPGALSAPPVADWVGSGAAYGIDLAPGQALTASSKGLQIAGKDEGRPLWGLRLSVMGREGALKPHQGPVWTRTGKGLEARSSGITEWAISRPEGVEHGFTLHRKPSGKTDGKVVLEMALAGTLRAEASSDGRAVHFSEVGGNFASLSYSGLVVKDASDRELACGMTVGSGAAGRILRILFDDSDAKYPVTVDPLVSAPGYSLSIGPCTDAEWGDFDGDGDLDLAVARWNNPVVVYANTGSGLSLAWTSAVAGYFRAVAWGDVDGDGDLDLAAGGSSMQDYLFRNNGGTLTTSPVWASSYFPNTYDLAFGDYDGDGDLDLAVAKGGGSYQSRIHINNSGVLATSAGWLATYSYSSTSVEWGDVNGDGRLDLVEGNFNAPDVLYLNNGSTLVPAWTTASGYPTYDTALGDYDGDGDLDLACGNYNAPSHIYRNDGGSFPSPANPTVSLGVFPTSSVDWGDWDGDGDLDLAVGTYGSNDRVYQNEPTGTMTLAWSSAPGDATWAARWGDWDGDGDLDLAVAAESGVIRVYTNTASPLALDAPDWSSTLTEETTACAWGDYDGDGDLDLVVGGLGIPLRLYRNVDGALETTAVWDSGAFLAYPFDLAWGDYDGDGDLDLVVADTTYQHTLYRNDGGTLNLVWFPSDPDPSYGVDWGDYDGDGDLDLAFAGWSGPNRIFRNDAGVFATTSTWSSDESAMFTDTAWVDVDGDHDLDLACSSTFGYAFVYLNDRGTLSTTAGMTLGGGVNAAWGMAWGDVDGDGDFDIVLANNNAPDELWRNDGGGTFTLAWSSTPTGMSFGLALGDADGDGDLDLVIGEQNTVAGLLHFYRNTGTGFAATPETSTAAGAARTGLSWGDMDGDGDLDLAATVYNGADVVFRNHTFVRPLGLPETASHPVAILRPGTTDSAGFLSSPELLSGTISIPYTLFDAEGDTAVRIVPQYSPVGGGHWLPATPGTGGDGTTDLLASSSGVAHTFAWDAEADTTDSDCVAFRITVLKQRPQRCGFPIQRPRLSATTPLFRVFPDPDGDGVRDSWDNCPQGYNPGQGQTLLGDRVWLDQDADGIQDAGEPGMANIPVLLYSAAGTFLEVDVTDATGAFGFGPFCPSDLFISVSLPPGYSFSMKDQGSDDALDSDVDRVTGRSTTAFFGEGAAGTSLDVGVVLGCTGPDEPVFISSVRKTIDGNDYPILDFQDPNQPSAVTGYDVHRSNDPAPSPDTWPRVASDIVDMDQATANKQWVDTSGNDPGAGGVWYYEIVAVSTLCGVTGPF